MLASMMNHPLDLAIASTLPTMGAPVHGTLPPLAVGERRILVGADQVCLEVRSLALHACVCIAKLWFPTPYGPIDTFIRLTGGPLPRSIFLQMVDAAVQAHPLEAARLVAWTDDGYRLVEPAAVAARVGQVQYQDTVDDCELVIDTHSHGPMGAYFSDTDDASDLSRPGPYIAIVLGECESKATTKVVARLCSGPFLIPVDLDEYDILERPA